MTAQKSENTPEFDLVRNTLSNLLDQRHALFKRAVLIDWQQFENELGSRDCGHNGSPGKPSRRMAGLEYLKQIDDHSDDKVVARWVENPDWQSRCGETYFQYAMPIEPSSPSRFRQRIGGSGCAPLLAASIQAGLKSRTVKQGNFQQAAQSFT